MGTIFKYVMKNIFELELTIYSMLRILKNFRQAAQFCKASNENLLVMGNGPSLQKQIKAYQHIFQKYDVVCVNRMYQCMYYNLVKPRYYVLCDPAFWGDANGAEINAKQIMG